MTRRLPAAPRRSWRPLAACLVFLAPGAQAFTDVPDQVTYAEHVAPIFYQHCVTCHRPDDVAPMSLLRYEEARPWAKSIQRVVTAREMPPWDADARYGEFANDISLSDIEVEILSRWVLQGARAGDLSLAPEPPPVPPPGSWRMGRAPDLVVELAPVEVPAGGPDLFVSQVVGLEVPAGKWVQAIEMLPGNTGVLHHVITYFGPFGIPDEDEEGNAGVFRTVYLNEAAQRPIGMAEAPSVGAVWVAGSPPTLFPPGMGHPLDANQLVSLNMHYHPSGEAGTDASKLGLYYGEGEMTKEITTAFAADPGILIPAGAADHRERASYLFSQDSKLLSLLPHMHQRGKSMRYTLTRPDGSREILLDVPEYDYDWQNIYRFAQPVAAPAGSLLEVEASWDNSADNPANPDPTLEVTWGDGTNFEMLVAFFDFVVDEGRKPRPTRTDEKIAALLARHDPARSYAIRIDGMGFGGPMGLVMPGPEEGDEGRFYMTFGSLMFSTSMPITFRAGDDLALNASIITSGGGTRMPLGLLTRRSGEGLEGEVFFGRELTPENVEAMRGQGRAFVGVPAGSAAAQSPGA
ncbi:MAG TPA: hypothetical protein VMV46_13090 [Thermoanaerobaculia bacterium]|nr:hypothetical protein [Thermoanaerobaculia bacterium]